MKVKGTKVKVGITALTEKQADLFDQVSIINSTLNKVKLTQN